MNKPYKKEFSETGELLNPIENGIYLSRTYLGLDQNKKPVFYPNRQERRSYQKKYSGNNRASTCDRKSSRLQFKQVIPANSFTKTTTDVVGNLVKENKYYPQRIIIHKTNFN